MATSDVFPSLLVLTLMLFCSGCESRTQEATKPILIPRSSMFATVPIDGMKRISTDTDLAGSGKEILNHLINLMPQASNVFLTSERNLKEAFSAAIRFESSPWTILQSEHKQRAWLVVFLGFAPTDPPRWSIKSIEFQERRIQVHFVTNLSPAKSGDIEPYFVLVPLEDLDNGTYQLELRDATTKEVTFMRRAQFERR